MRLSIEIRDFLLYLFAFGLTGWLIVFVLLRRERERGEGAAGEGAGWIWSE